MTASKRFTTARPADPSPPSRMPPRPGWTLIRTPKDSYHWYRA
ncbi:hypothetical protein [Streptomyces sp. NPDC093105]